MSRSTKNTHTHSRPISKTHTPFHNHRKMSNPTGDYNRYAAGPSRLHLSSVNQHHRFGTDTPRDDNDAPQRNKVLLNDNGIMSNPTANYSRYATGPSGLYLSTVNQHQRFGTDTPRDDIDAPQRNKVLLNDNEIITLPSAESLSNAGSRKRNLGKGLYQDYEEQKKRQQIEYIKLFEPRSDYLRAHLRSLSSGVKLECRTDRPAVCNFFAEGRCVKGNSCRFLHVKERKLVSADFQHSVGYKKEMSSYSWEPSTPFQPSFEFTRRLLSSVNEFNFIRDSREESKACEIHTQNYGNDFVPVEAGTPVTSIIEMQNTSAAPEEEKISGSTHLRDLTKSTPNTQSDKQKTESVDIAGREADATIGDLIARNPEFLENFRTMFKNYVKVLIKPTWREGNLSKAVHKMIVKATVDKIMGTIQQLPVSQLGDDSLKQNIANFVEYYMDKYEKL